jgi:hypothetical protein
MIRDRRQPLDHCVHYYSKGLLKFISDTQYFFLPYRQIYMTCEQTFIFLSEAQNLMNDGLKHRGKNNINL